MLDRPAFRRESIVVNGSYVDHDPISVRIDILSPRKRRKISIDRLCINPRRSQEIQITFNVVHAAHRHGANPQKSIDADTPVMRVSLARGKQREHHSISSSGCGESEKCGVVGARGTRGQRVFEELTLPVPPISQVDDAIYVGRQSAKELCGPTARNDHINRALRLVIAQCSDQRCCFQGVAQPLGGKNEKPLRHRIIFGVQ